jgi:hypothetical protein
MCSIWIILNTEIKQLHQCGNIPGVMHSDDVYYKEESAQNKPEIQIEESSFSSSSSELKKFMMVRKSMNA